MRTWRRTALALPLLAVALGAQVAGKITFRGEAVPGAIVSAARAVPGARTAAGTTSDAAGLYRLTGLVPGQWELRVSLRGFLSQTATVTVGAKPVATNFALQLASALPSGSALAPALKAPTAGTQTSPNELAPGAALVVNGSENNGSASPYAQAPAFGNNRRHPSLYHGALKLVLGASALDARSDSLSGLMQPRPGYAHLVGGLSLGGPMLIPGLPVASRPAQFFVSYQRTDVHNSTVADGLVPTAAERAGDLSAVGGPVLAPGQISTGAAALLKLYPLPNTSGIGYNYQVPLLEAAHGDQLQLQLDQSFAESRLSGALTFNSTRTSTPNLFDFLDTGANLGLTADVSLWHSFGRGFYGTLDLHYTRRRQRLRPFFAGRENISAAAGMSGNSQAPRDWGPPELRFSSGIAPLSDAAAGDNRDQTTELSWDARWLHGKHDVEFGAAFRRLEFNLLQQSNARGTLVFNGAATGNDLQDFLLGLPDAAQLAFGNADKYFRESAGDGFLTDNWQATGSLSLDLGVRWDYSGPVGERYGRLVNLAVAPGFASATPIVGHGAVMRPDFAGFQPGLGLAWRPFGLADFVLRAGYGVYFDSSPYEMIAQRMAQQAPLSKSLQVAATPAAPLSFANAFASAPGAGMTTFAVDPEFRQGYVQIWNASVETGLPGDTALTATYQGSRGAHGMQEFLPNTVPPGAAIACASCPVGFTYLDSNGSSAYQGGTLQLQRRLSDGLLALLSYTYSKNMDNSAPGGSTPALAQNWRDLDAEWAPADTDQRNRASAAVQYSTGLERWSQRLPHAWERNAYRGWTLATQITAASGQPLTPVTSLLVPGTGVAGSVRPDVTGAAVGAAPLGRFVNPAAYAPPAPGAWGSAGRNSIRGSSQFDLDASLARSFKLPVLGHGLDTLFRLDATNALNHVRYTSFDTTFGSALFGLPTSTQPMRKLLATLRIRF